MKKQESSKKSNIRTEQELIYYFRELLKEDPDLQWKNFHEYSDHDYGDGQVCLELDGRGLKYEVEFKLKPSIPNLDELCTQNEHAQTLLVAPSLTNRVLQFCKERKLSCIDLNGRAWLRADGLLVDRQASSGRSFNYQLEPRNVFEGKSGRVVRSLLSEKDRVWTQAELVKRSRASSGMVSRLVQHFVSQSYLEKLSAREYLLNDFDGLLEEWHASDDFQKRCTTSYYAGPISGIEQIAHDLHHWAQNESVEIAFTQWFAAYQRHPYTDPGICSAYLDRLPDAATLESFGLRSVAEGGKVWLHVPEDEGVFLETQSSNKHPLKLVSDAQIYVDLKHAGLRGPDAARALREWEGFCRK